MKFGIMRKKVVGSYSKRDRSSLRIVQTGSLLFCLSVVLLLFSSLATVIGGDRPDVDTDKEFAEKRKSMVAQQIKARGVGDKKVLRALSTVPRHLFVQPKLRRMAYEDTPMPIGHGQTISQPYIVAYMTEIIDPKPHHRVLEIGTGSGYQAAILAELIDKVYTMEIIPELAREAGDRLKKLGYSNVQVKQGDGYYGWPDAAPFDAIVVTAAAEFIPPPLIKQLKDGGRMIIPVGSQFRVQHLTLVEKKKDKVTTRNLMPVRFVPFRRSQ